MQFNRIQFVKEPKIRLFGLKRLKYYILSNAGPSELRGPGQPPPPILVPFRRQRTDVAGPPFVTRSQYIREAVTNAFRVLTLINVRDVVAVNRENEFDAVYCATRREQTAPAPHAPTRRLCRISVRSVKLTGKHMHINDKHTVVVVCRRRRRRSRRMIRRKSRGEEVVGGERTGMELTNPSSTVYSRTFDSSSSSSTLLFSIVFARILII